MHERSPYVFSLHQLLDLHLFNNLPIPRSKNAVAVSSSTEILVIGGSIGSVNVNTIIKGTLEISIEKI